MIKARGSINGHDTIFLGLSFANLAKLKANPLDDHILIKGKDLSLPFDIIITAGETEAAIAHMIEPLIGPHTKVHVDDKLKS